MRCQSVEQLSLITLNRQWPHQRIPSSPPEKLATQHSSAQLTNDPDSTCSRVTNPSTPLLPPTSYPPNPISRDNKSHGDRDVFNEKPTREEQTVAIANAPHNQSSLPTTATIHTTMGDMSFKLFPEHAPKTVENFAGLAKRGYFDGVIFHRVIKKFVSRRLRWVRGNKLTGWW